MSRNESETSDYNFSAWTPTHFITHYEIDNTVGKRRDAVQCEPTTKVVTSDQLPIDYYLAVIDVRRKECQHNVDEEHGVNQRIEHYNDECRKFKGDEERDHSWRVQNAHQDDRVPYRLEDVAVPDEGFGYLRSRQTVDRNKHVIDLCLQL